MEDRLSKVLAHAGLASRREADRLVQEGRVTVNGTVTTEPGVKVDLERDHVKVDGKLLQAPQPTYVLVNKPRGVLAGRDAPEGMPSVISLMPNFKGRLLPVGRLERDDEGAMLLTSDGALAAALNKPNNGYSRAYLIKVRGIPDERTLLRMRNGVPLMGGRSLPMDVKVVSVTGRNTWLQVTTRQGRSHMLEHMMLKLRHPLVKLKRLTLGPLSIKGLAPGTFRKLIESEVSALKALAASPPGLPAPVHLTPEEEEAALTTLVEARKSRQAAQKGHRANRAPATPRAARGAPESGARPGAGPRARTGGAPRTLRPEKDKSVGRIKRNVIAKARSGR